jgi:hypothetical protein
MKRKGKGAQILKGKGAQIASNEPQNPHYPTLGVVENWVTLRQPVLLREFRLKLNTNAVCTALKFKFFFTFVANYTIYGTGVLVSGLQSCFSWGKKVTGGVRKGTRCFCTSSVAMSLRRSSRFPLSCFILELTKIDRMETNDSLILNGVQKKIS